MFKFGDLIANNCNGADNPYHVIMVVSVSGGFINCIADNGRKLKFSCAEQKKDLFLRIVGKVDFTDWKIAKNTEQQVQPDTIAELC